MKNADAAACTLLGLAFEEADAGRRASTLDIILSSADSEILSRCAEGALLVIVSELNAMGPAAPLHKVWRLLELCSAVASRDSVLSCFEGHDGGWLSKV
jgi:hypothetical protein